jgi:hypothetical protein
MELHPGASGWIFKKLFKKGAVSFGEQLPTLTRILTKIQSTASYAPF